MEERQSGVVTPSAERGKEMSIHEEMHNLTQEIIGSYESRVAGITSLRGEVTSQRQAARVQLRELDKSRKAMARQQHADLAKGRADLTKDVRQQSAEVNAWIKEVANAHADARGEWQNLTITMQARRAGAAGAAGAVAPSPPVEEELRNRVFKYLANHPDGIRMAELEQVFGVPRIQMAGVLKSFIAQNKVQKRGLLYFAI
jgi:hypothetical protein